MSSEASIVVEGLSKCHHIYDKPRDRLLQLLHGGRRQYYREFWALRDVSFEVARGETIGLIGRNGSGKSTLLQMICGTLAPTSGTVKTRGRVAALLELGAGFNPEFTGRENIIMNGAILGLTRDEIEARMQDVIEFSELAEFIERPVKTYSSGMYSRLAFSIAINVDPDILIVDEALSVGDARFVAKCMRRIKDIQGKGATILFVSHDVGSVRSLCSRAIWINKGTLVEVGDVFPVTGRYMEFMFQDDDVLPTAQTLDAPVETVAIDARPSTHWGSEQGLIKSASVCDAQGNRRDVLEWGERVQVLLEISLPDHIPLEHLCISFSIKDLKGTDLIVSTTQQDMAVCLAEGRHFSISFALDNLLVSGKYLLVAAVENRQGADIHYYEYLEGAHYFSSLAPNFFGLVQPRIEQQLKVKQ
ncbi:ABC transporter ATP-binding protein [Herbaspirillum huttiense]|uniref:ABC transporter ATP-binding protein n=1 Tax=Herbaspirillum huttiense TaxID=863372 RepID=UPI001064E2B6|nr:ABC transporter ATP-binding protein [Herbaspirillum huttiense]QBP73983.1 ABC transporter ATP-binding protein [Herbaspirillum huttiense]